MSTSVRVETLLNSSIELRTQHGRSREHAGLATTVDLQTGDANLSECVGEDRVHTKASCI